MATPLADFGENGHLRDCCGCCADCGCPAMLYATASVIAGTLPTIPGHAPGCTWFMQDESGAASCECGAASKDRL